jgi:peptide/nickel transport system permease protein
MIGNAPASLSIGQAAQPQRASQSFRQIAWRRFRANRVAILSTIFLMVIYGLALAAPWIAPYDPNQVNIMAQHEPASSEHWLGTDENGRDELSRLMYGGRITLTVGFVAMVVGLLIGVIIGSLAGFNRGAIDTILMRFTDGMLAIPYFFLILIVVSVFGSSLRNLIIVIGATSWMSVARIVRSEVLRLKEQDYVTAARSLGASSPRILVRHVVPHTVPILIVAATLGIANAILLESALSYLGLGIKPPHASWGNMLSNSQAYIWDNPLLALYPGLLIFASVLCFNFIGDAMRDALDPRLRN